MKKKQKQLWVLVALIGLCGLHVAMGNRNPFADRVGGQTSLQPFEGFYRFPNRVAYIQFEIIDDQLEARQVWDDRRYSLKRTGNLTFESIEEEYKLAFNGLPPTAVKILERVDLIKVDFDPTQRKLLSDSLAHLYQGDYYLQRDETYVIKIFPDSDGLMLVQEWDGKRIPLACITDREFINQDAAMPVTFYADESKETVEMQCFQDDRWVKAGK